MKPNEAVAILSTPLLIFLIPLLLIMGVFIYIGIEFWSIISFALFSLVYALIFPHLGSFFKPQLFKPLDSKHVDLAYYTFAIIGVVLFFSSDRITKSEYKNSNDTAHAYQKLAFTDNIIADSLSWIDIEKNNSQAKKKLFALLESYIHEYSKGRGECSPVNYKKYPFCKKKIIQPYLEAKKQQNKGKIQFSGRGRNQAVQYLRQIFQDEYVSITFSSKIYGKQKLKLKANTVFNVLYYGNNKTRDVAIGVFKKEIQNKKLHAGDSFANIEKKHLQLNSFGEIKYYWFHFSNIWPFLLCALLSMKIARTKYKMEYQK
jgi:hypothetical protein